MKDIASSSPVFLVLSLIVSLILLVVGLIIKGKSKGKNTAGWICIGIGGVAIITNALQLIMKF